MDLDLTHPPISICFQDGEISFLFAQLLEAKGIQAREVVDIHQVRGETRVITEPKYFSHLPAPYQETCLVVGNQDAVGHLPVLTLTRPLTEDKIELALSEFLKG